MVHLGFESIDELVTVDGCSFEANFVIGIWVAKTNRERHMVGDMCAPLVSGFIVINQSSTIFIVFIFILEPILGHSVRGKSAQMSFGQIIREGVKIKVVVNPVKLGRRDGRVSPFAIPGVKALFNLLQITVSKPALVFLAEVLALSMWKPLRSPGV